MSSHTNTSTQTSLAFSYQMLESLETCPYPAVGKSWREKAAGADRNLCVTLQLNELQLQMVCRICQYVSFGNVASH